MSSFKYRPLKSLMDHIKSANESDLIHARLENVQGVYDLIDRILAFSSADLSDLQKVKAIIGALLVFKEEKNLTPEDKKSALFTRMDTIIGIWEKNQLTKEEINEAKNIVDKHINPAPQSKFKYPSLEKITNEIALLLQKVDKHHKDKQKPIGAQREQQITSLNNLIRDGKLFKLTAEENHKTIILETITKLNELVLNIKKISQYIKKLDNTKLSQVSSDQEVLHRQQSLKAAQLEKQQLISEAIARIQFAITFKIALPEHQVNYLLDIYKSTHPQKHAKLMKKIEKTTKVEKDQLISVDNDLDSIDQPLKTLTSEQRATICVGALLFIKNEIKKEYDTWSSWLVKMKPEDSVLYNNIDPAIGINKNNPLDSLAEKKSLELYNQFVRISNEIKSFDKKNLRSITTSPAKVDMLNQEKREKEMREELQNRTNRAYHSGLVQAKNNFTDNTLQPPKSLIDYYNKLVSLGKNISPKEVKIKNKLAEIIDSYTPVTEAGRYERDISGRKIVVLSELPDSITLKEKYRNTYLFIMDQEPALFYVDTQYRKYEHLYERDAKGRLIKEVVAQLVFIDDMDKFQSNLIDLIPEDTIEGTSTEILDDFARKQSRAYLDFQQLNDLITENGGFSHSKSQTNYSTMQNLVKEIHEFDLSSLQTQTTKIANPVLGKDRKPTPGEVETYKKMKKPNSTVIGQVKDFNEDWNEADYVNADFMKELEEQSPVSNKVAMNYKNYNPASRMQAPNLFLPKKPPAKKEIKNESNTMRDKVIEKIRPSDVAPLELFRRKMLGPNGTLIREKSLKPVPDHLKNETHKIMVQDDMERRSPGLKK